MLKKIICSMLIALIVSTEIVTSASASSTNIVDNPSFENEVSGVPEAWRYETYNKNSGAAEFKLEKENAHSGNKFVTIINNEENDSRFIQAIKVKQNTNYKLSCWIKTKNVGQQGKGANLSIGNHLETSKEIKDTNDVWQYVEMYAKIGDNIETINVTIGVGGYRALSTGQASFDDVTIEEVESIPNGAIVANIEKPKEDQNKNSNSSENFNSIKEDNGKGSLMWIIILITIVMVVLASFAVIKYSPKEVDGEEGKKEEDEDFDEEIE